MAASAQEYPELARAFYDAGPGAFQQRIAGFLDACVAAQLLTVADTGVAAEILMSAWIGLDQLRASLGKATDVGRARVRQATKALARGWGYEERR
jgi:TetR/AcrR family transcriptional repressor of mexJK operon